MADNSSEKIVGISGLPSGKAGKREQGRAAVTMTELTSVSLLQLAVFPEQMKGFRTSFKRQTGIGDLPDFSDSVQDKNGLVVRPEITKFWLLRAASASPVTAPSLAKYFPLDLSGSRVFLRLRGPQAAALINRFCAVDLSVPPGRFIATGMHHVGIHILKQAEADFVLFLPRSFAESLAETLYHSALQFGVEVNRPAAWRGLG